MKKTRMALVACSVGLLAGCDSFLDVNTNPNAPETVAANLYLPPMLDWLVTTPMFDGRGIGRYTQQWMLPTTTTTPTNFDRMGYDAGSDFGGEQWRTTYFVFGHNLIDMMNRAEAEQRWDVLGVGYVLKAWGWQAATDIHGEIILKEAFDQSKTTFKFDPQEEVYAEVRRLLGLAIANLERTDGAVSAAYLARGDKIYNGDRQKWLKFAHGLMAMNLNHYGPNKPGYDPNAVIAAVDRSLASNADDALLEFPATFSADANFYGPTRNNLTNYRQTQFVVNLMNGTVFTGAVDPRMRGMLAPAPDGQIRGLDINVGNSLTALPVNQRPGTFFNRYLFGDRSKVPAMTYAQLQFVKAEAALYANRRDVALAAYRNGITAHMDFVNARNAELGATTIAPITAAERAAYLANTSVVPTAAGLTLSHILPQKYIAQWAWGHNELWMDMRRYHYTDMDPVAPRQVYPTFEIPRNLFVDNGGEPVYRLRPRFNSEYVWNRESLDAIGGLAPNFHTKQTWIVQR
jgi:hypothetical protein